LGQSFGDLELIISDNASTDDTQAISCAYARRDNRVLYVRQTENLGAAANFNAAYALTQGEYFKWATHDDLLAPDFLEQCVAALEHDPSAVLCAPAARLIDANGEPLRPCGDKHWYVDSKGERWYIPMVRHAETQARDAATRFRAFVTQPPLCFDVFGLIRRSAMERTSLIGPYWGGDKVFLSELCLIAPFVLLDAPLLWRRCHKAQSSALSRRDRESWIAEGRRIPTFQQPRMLFQYVRVLGRHDLSRGQKARCVMFLIGRSGSPAKIREVARAFFARN
jgi:glycosyltransferase involved in cell wall biosynthesis